MQLKPPTEKTAIKFPNADSLAASIYVSFSSLIYSVAFLINEYKKCIPGWILVILLSDLNLSK